MEVLPQPAITGRLDEPLLDVLLRNLNNEKTQAATTVTGDQGNQDLLRRLTNVARDLSQASTLREEIEHLAGTALAIDRSFYEIERTLSRINKSTRGDDRLSPVCSSLLSKWTQHHKEYKKLLSQSRGVAGTAQGVLDEFLRHILPFLRNDAVPVAEKQRKIADHLKVVEQNAAESQRRSRAFQDFSEDLKTSVSEFSDEVESLDLDDQSETVRSLNKDFQSAMANLAAISGEIAKLALVAMGKVSITGVAVWLATMAPGWWAIALVTGVVGTTLVYDPLGIRSSGKGLCEAVTKWPTAAGTCYTTKRELDKQRNRLHQMKDLQSTIFQCEEVVEGACEKLSIFVSVWSYMDTDLREIQSALYFAEIHATASNAEQFADRLNHLETLYGYLRQALHHYQALTGNPRQSQSPSLQALWVMPDGFETLLNNLLALADLMGVPLNHTYAE